MEEKQKVIVKKIIEVFREENLTFEDAYIITDKVVEALKHLSKLAKI